MDSEHYKFLQGMSKTYHQLSILNEADTFDKSTKTKNTLSTTSFILLKETEMNVKSGIFKANAIPTTKSALSIHLGQT